MDTLYFVVQQTMFFSIPLLIVAIGAMFSERSGVINIALEGTMIIGAFASILFIHVYQAMIPGQPVLIIAIFIAVGAGMLVSLAHAYASINMRANQIISGTAINLFAPAFAIYFARMQGRTQQIPFVNQFRIDSVPILGDIPFKIGRAHV